MIAFVVLSGLFIVCMTLVTRWALKFAQTVEEKREREAEEPDEEEDLSVSAVNHVNDDWDEIFFEGRRYRKCLRYGHHLYNSGSIGWLHYPEGTPLEASDWLKVEKEYKRRCAVDENSKIAKAARLEWSGPPWRQKVGSEETVEPDRRDDSDAERRREAIRKREEELDRLVEEAEEATRRASR